MENESSIKNIINDSLQQIRTFIDADTIVGKQIVTPGGTVIIPISKLSMGFASGGLDLPSKNSNGAKNFGGGGGTGVSVSPIGFLIVSPEGKVEMLPISQEKSGPVEQVFDLLDQAPDLIRRIMSAFSGDGKDSSPSEEEIQKKEEEISKKLEVELASVEVPATPKEEKQDAKAAKRAAKEAKRAAKAAKRAAYDYDEDDDDEDITSAAPF
ncbi:MAG: hypothetical protein IJX28_02310 [Clostridia bacterium]|nr:hypothetical protein [Clostridia bacterium]